jgi:prepilin-type N-terminal cleavage/methylation domain-containing protein
MPETEMQFSDNTNVLTRTRRPRRRHAMTLAEIMVAVALSSILLGMVISLAVSLQQWDRRLRGNGVRSDNVAQLGEILRSDIRHATEVTMPEQEVIIVTSPDQAKVKYELKPDGCRRTMTPAGSAAESHELFAIGSGTSWQVERDTSGRRPAIAVTLSKSPEDDQARNGSNMYVYAALGADNPNGAKAGNSSSPKSAE